MLYHYNIIIVLVFFVTVIPTTCNFEESPLGDLCIFTQNDLDDDFDWTRYAGETPSLDTGPLADHTEGDATGMVSFNSFFCSSSSLFT